MKLHPLVAVLAAALFPWLSSAGCAPGTEPIDAEPPSAAGPAVALVARAEIDATFGDERIAAITRGIAQWAPLARFEIRARDPEELRASAGREDGVVTVLREGCALGVAIDSGALATTWGTKRGALVCVDAAAVDAMRGVVPDAWALVLAHEVGHALGLGHDTSHPRTTVMAPSLNDVVPVTCHDLETLAAARGLPTPAAAAPSSEAIEGDRGSSRARLACDVLGALRVGP